jgi:hypothetical protein
MTPTIYFYALTLLNIVFFNALLYVSFKRKDYLHTLLAPFAFLLILITTFMFNLSFVETSNPSLEYEGINMNSGLDLIYLVFALFSSIIILFISFKMKKIYIGIIVSSILLFSASIYKVESAEIQYSEHSEENDSNN